MSMMMRVLVAGWVDGECRVGRDEASSMLMVLVVCSASFVLAAGT